MTGHSLVTHWSDTIRHYQTLSDTIRHYQTLSDTIRHYQTLTDTDRQCLLEERDVTSVLDRKVGPTLTSHEFKFKGLSLQPFEARVRPTFGRLLLRTKSNILFIILGRSRRIKSDDE